MNALHDAIDMQELEQVKKALNKRNIESKKGGWTPLHCTIFSNSPEIAEYLLEHGANANARGQDNETPLHVAAPRNRIEIARLLLAFGADTAAKDANGHTPLYWAKDNGDDEMVALLQTPPPRRTPVAGSTGGAKTGGFLGFLKGMFGGAG